MADAREPRRRASDEERVLHARLLQGDALAPSDLVAAHLVPLFGWLCQKFPGVDETLLHDIATDSLLNLGQAPEKYDPDRLMLSSYLRMDARGDLLNALKAARPGRFREISLDAVELSPSARNRLVSGARATVDPADAVVEHLERVRLARHLDELQGTDREVVQLIWEGERHTTVFARVLGVQDRPRAEQEREVKRTKDRLKAWLKRRRHRMMDDD